MRWTIPLLLLASCVGAPAAPKREEFPACAEIPAIRQRLEKARESLDKLTADAADAEILALLEERAGLDGLVNELETACASPDRAAIERASARIEDEVIVAGVAKHVATEAGDE